MSSPHICLLYRHVSEYSNENVIQISLFAYKNPVLDPIANRNIWKRQQICHLKPSLAFLKRL